LGVEERSLPMWIADALRIRHPGIALIDATETVRTIRAIKTPEEIERLRRAADIMEGAVNDMLEALRTGITEAEAARIYAEAVAHRGGENIFNLVLGFGPSGAVSHCIPGERALHEGDMVRFDLGARFRGYHADTAVSRLWKTSTAEQERIYRGVLDSQRAAAALLRPGVPVSRLYEEAIRVARGFIPEFRMEHVGHGIGVEHHENPPFIQRGGTLLEPDMVVNVETLYLDPRHGGFAVEDTYRITETGAEQWTQFDRSARIA
jgi:Xaa-Pro aminopeptidase